MIEKLRSNHLTDDDKNLNLLSVISHIVNDKDLKDNGFEKDMTGQQLSLRLREL